MLTVRESSPFSSFESVASPNSEKKEGASKEAAAIRLQRIGRAFLERNECFFKSNLKKILISHARLIPATEAQVDAIYNYAWAPSISPEPEAPILVNQKDGKQIDLSILLEEFLPTSSPGQKGFVEGSFKKIFPSLFVCSSPSQRIFSISQKATVFIKSIKKLPEEDQKRIHAQITREVELLQELNDTLKRKGISGAYLVSSFETLTPEKTYLQDWYPSDLQRAINKKSVFLNFNPTDPPKPFSEEHALGCLHNIAQTLKIMHLLGYVHRDVKSLNMLVSFEEGGFVGRLTDFTFMTKQFGWDRFNTQGDYAFWDPLAVCNVSTPIVDRYGVALTFILLLSPNTSYKYFKKIRDEIICSMVMNPKATLTPKSDAHPFEREFRLICIESMLVLFSILKDEGIDIPAAFKEARRKLQASETSFSDTLISIKLIQALVNNHQGLFIHGRIVEAMKSTAAEMAELGYPACTMEDLIKKIDETHYERSIGTEVSSQSSCVIC